MREKLIFASIMMPSESSQINCLLLAESIRSFAGALSRNPIWCFVPEYVSQDSGAIRDRLLALNVSLIPFKTDLEDSSFPSACHVRASASAESLACERTDLLAWLDNNTIVLHDPRDFLLQDGISLGFRPVHHTLVGSRYDQPLDPFWTLIYRSCNVPEERVFPMITHVDGTTIRPYFNSGLIVTRPKKRLLQVWRDTFFAVYKEPSFERFYEQDRRYRVFINQAVLSGVVLSMLTADEIRELPAKYNYPLHLHAQDKTAHRPSCLEESVTFRHEAFYEDPNWIKKLPAKEPLKRWLSDRLS